jgi:hypothetical protein
MGTHTVRDLPREGSPASVRWCGRQLFGTDGRHHLTPTAGGRRCPQLTPLMVASICDPVLAVIIETLNNRLILHPQSTAAMTHQPRFLWGWTYAAPPQPALSSRPLERKTHRSLWREECPARSNGKMPSAGIQLTAGPSNSSYTLPRRSVQDWSQLLRFEELIPAEGRGLAWLH